MGLLAGLLMIFSLGYGMIFAFQCLAAYSAPKSDPCRSSTSCTSMGVGFYRAAEVNRKNAKKEAAKMNPSPVSTSSSNQYFTLPDDEYKPIPAIRSPTVRSLV
uniref:Uncharacterized protein n=1 Tax=Panagrolaimus superbus TaxID=310955 RepID=A0A914XVL1_9BILA